MLAALKDYFAGQGIEAGAERTTVTSGAISGLYLAFRAALEPGDLALVEAPTYSDALMTLKLVGARTIEIPMDEDGAQVDEIPRIAAREGKPGLIYVIPTFHNPTGVTMSAKRRERLVEVANELGSVLIEDDAYGRFRFRGDTLAPIALAQQEGRPRALAGQDRRTGPSNRIGGRAVGLHRRGRPPAGRHGHLREHAQPGSGRAIHRQ